MTTITSQASPPRRGPTAPGQARGRAESDAAVRLAAVALLWLSLLLVTYWWVADRGLQDLGAWATGLTSVGRLAGLVGSVLLLAQVVLMARTPLLEGAFGQDRLARLHRLTGFTSFTLMLVHIAAITWGYASGRLAGTPAMLWDLTVRYPGMLLAVAGAGCLCMVVVTSLRAARRRLRYESWHLLHLYAYLGVGLALPHQMWTGQELLGSPAKTAFWWTAWALAAGTALVWRVALPVWRNALHGLRVASVRPEGNGVASVYLTGRRLDRLPAEAGQFFLWRFLGQPGWTRAHPYSLSAPPEPRGLRITVQAVGDGSAAAFSLRPGTRALVEGPYGRLSARARTRDKIALFGAGVGITPLRALAEALPYAPGDAALLHRYTSEPLFAREFEALARDRGLWLVPLPGRRRHPDSWLGDGLRGIDGLDDVAVLQGWLPDLAERDVFVCGPDRWAELLRRSLAEAGLPSDNLHLETFAW